MSGKRRGGRVDEAGRRVRAAIFPRISRQTPLQRHFLERLERLVLLAHQGEQRQLFSEGEAALLKKATYSVYRDCLELGVVAEARSIMRARWN